MFRREAILLVIIDFSEPLVFGREEGVFVGGLPALLNPESPSVLSRCLRWFVSAGCNSVEGDRV